MIYTPSVLVCFIIFFTLYLILCWTWKCNILPLLYSKIYIFLLTFSYFIISFILSIFYYTRTPFYTLYHTCLYICENSNCKYHYELWNRGIVGQSPYVSSIWAIVQHSHILCTLISISSWPHSTSKLGCNLCLRILV